MHNLSSTPPLVTIITVTYNSSRYVRDAIESVLRQSYFHLEYIISDDASTDNTWDIIEEYTDERIRKYRNEVNLGEYSNRNKAIQLAKGKYFIFIDGDDIIYPHAIYNFVYYLEKYPQACMAIQKGYYNNLVFPFLLEPRDQYINYFFGKANLLVSSFASNFFRTAIVRERGLAIVYKSGDDEIRLRLAAEYPVLYIPGWHTWPRETPGQASSRIPEEVAVLQLNKYVSNIISNSKVLSSDKELINAIRLKLRSLIIKVILRKMKRMQFIKAISVLRESGIRPGELFVSGRPNKVFEDITSLYTPERPFVMKDK